MEQRVRVRVMDGRSERECGVRLGVRVRVVVEDE